MSAVDQDREPVVTPPGEDASSAGSRTGDPIARPQPSNASPTERIERIEDAVVPTGRTRGTRHTPLLRIRGDLDLRWRIGLGFVGVAVILGMWHVAATSIVRKEAILPTPAATWSALLDLQADGTLAEAMWVSTLRILVGYAISVAIGIVIGLLIGSYRSVESFFEPQIGFLRYIPASALTPLFLIWFGIGETPKIWLIVLGSVFFNIVMMADVARDVPRELLNAAYTLGAGRWTVMRRVILRHSIPGIIDVARVNLAAAWLMLVVAEVLAADQGLAYQIVRAQRFRAVDSMFALLIVLGVIGLVSDLALRGLRNVAAPWSRS
jgi:NitT/TauT family transport system permease protein